VLVVGGHDLAGDALELAGPRCRRRWYRRRWRCVEVLELLEAKLEDYLVERFVDPADLVQDPLGHDWRVVVRDPGGEIAEE
jgi:hypothetical protein